MADASFKDVPEIFEVRLQFLVGKLISYISLQVELGESVTARTESLCMSALGVRREGTVASFELISIANSHIQRTRTARLMSRIEEYRANWCA